MTHIRCPTCNWEATAPNEKAAVAKYHKHVMTKGHRSRTDSFFDRELKRLGYMSGA